MIGPQSSNRVHPEWIEALHYALTEGEPSVVQIDRLQELRGWLMAQKASGHRAAWPALSNDYLSGARDGWNAAMTQDQDFARSVLGIGRAIPNRAPSDSPFTDPVMEEIQGNRDKKRGGSSSPMTPGAGDATQGAKDGAPGTPSDSPPPLHATPNHAAEFHTVEFDTVKFYRATSYAPAMLTIDPSGPGETGASIGFNGTELQEFVKWIQGLAT